MGDEMTSGMLKHDKELANFDGVNCGFWANWLAEAAD